MQASRVRRAGRRRGHPDGSARTSTTRAAFRSTRRRWCRCGLDAAEALCAGPRPHVQCAWHLQSRTWESRMAWTWAKWDEAPMHEGRTEHAWAGRKTGHAWVGEEEPRERGRVHSLPKQRARACNTPPADANALACHRYRVAGCKRPSELTKPKP
eukprot:364789-Chlamydomonas_euryale.AAC.15